MLKKVYSLKSILIYELILILLSIFLQQETNDLFLHFLLHPNLK